MTCRPESVTAFVDGELESAERLELERHLGACRACAEQAEAETELHGRLRRLSGPEPPAGLEHAVRRKLRAARRARWRLPAALAAALVAAVAWGRGAAPIMAWQLAQDHRHCFSRDKLPAELWTSKIRTAEDWLRARGAELPPLPAVVSGIELVGVRQCRLLDRRVVHLYYTDSASRLSLFVVPEPVRFERGYAANVLGRPVRLRRVAGRVVGIVAERQADVEAFDRAFQTTLASAEPPDSGLFLTN